MTTRIVDPRAVRVALSPLVGHPEVVAVVIEPSDDGGAIVDGEPLSIRFDRSGPTHGVLTEHDQGPQRTSVIILGSEPPGVHSDWSTAGARRSGGLGGREVIVDGWRVEVDLESERRASLRDRARRGREDTARDGPTEVHAIIPGRIVSVSVVPGDTVVAGQQLLVVEAMKMQNEVRAPRDAVISKVAVGSGRTIEVGDLLVVLE